MKALPPPRGSTRSPPWLLYRCTTNWQPPQMIGRQTCRAYTPPRSPLDRGGVRLPGRTDLWRNKVIERLPAAALAQEPHEWRARVQAIMWEGRVSFPFSMTSRRGWTGLCPPSVAASWIASPGRHAQRHHEKAVGLWRTDRPNGALLTDNC